MIRRILIVTALAVIVLGVSMQLIVGDTFRKDVIPPGKASKPILRMELVSDPGDVSNLLGKKLTEDGLRRHDKMTRVQYLDFPFIAAYVLLIAATGLALAGGSRWRPLAFLALLLIALAGVFDVLEDRAILNVVAAGTDNPDGVRRFALVKWALFGAAVMLQGAILLLRGKPPSRLLYGLYTMTGVIAFAAGSWCIERVYGGIDAAIQTGTNVAAIGMLLVFVCAMIQTRQAPRRSL